jgi:phenylacetate-CoA ligase
MDLNSFYEFPLTAKKDIEAFNDDFCAVPREKIVDIVLSSGTTGKPTRIMYTEADLQRLAYNEKISLAGCGITNSDTALLTCTMDRCFIAGLAYFSGLRGIGAAVIRNGQNTLESHASIIISLHPSVVVGVPGFLRKLGHFMVDSGLESQVKSINKLVCIGEPIRDRQLRLTATGEDLKRLWQAQLYSTYASSETITSFCECEAGMGGHLLADLALAEIIDDNGNRLSPGNPGEVVITPFGITGMPLVRFKTGDISCLLDEACSCGRNTQRLGPIQGRKAQMLKLKGTTLYPQAIFAVLESFDQIEEYYIQVEAQSDLSDQVTLYTAVQSSSLTPETIQNRLQASLRVKPDVKIEPLSSILKKVMSPGSRKPMRFFDNRKN